MSNLNQRSIYISGGLMVLSGVIHFFVWAYLGGDWEGPVSWRKPILFGLSTGATLISLGWIYPKVKNRSYDSFAVPIFSLVMFAEVALITMQQWRGVASHFNQSTKFDASVDIWTTVLVSLGSLFVFDLGFRAFGKLKAKSDWKLAIRAGMGFLLLSIVLGFGILALGQIRAAEGLNPSQFGNAGVPKFPHGIAIHAIQYFPILIWVLTRIGVSQKDRLGILFWSVMTMAWMMVFSLVQTLRGRGRFEVDLVGIALLSLVLLAMTWTLIQSFLGIGRSLSSRKSVSGN